jgi:hypothetical protein
MSEVRYAIQQQDSDLLAGLFAQGRMHLGEGVGVVWARVLSGWDAGAVTG